mgnify:CR=1 FL=1
MSSVITAKGIKKTFGNGTNKNTVLKGIDFLIEEGQFVSIMGPSGCGKSTLLYLLGGLDKPTDGQILLMDKDINKMSDSKLSSFRRQELGFVFQFYNLVQNLTVEENILLPIKMMRAKERKDNYDKLEDILELVDLVGKEKYYPSQLSGGQQQRVAIARAVITNPSIILADEPTGNLDHKNGIAVMEMFKRINKERNITIVQVTHDEEKVCYGNRLIRLLDGEICEDVAV